MFKRHERLYLTIIVLGALVCLSPLFLLNDTPRNSADDFPPNVLIDQSTSLYTTFFVVLIPAADLILDFPGLFFSYFYRDSKYCSRQSESSFVIRLTDVERLLFIVGVAIQSTVSFLPDAVSMQTVSLANTCINNCSILLTLGPICVFLQRCTTTFTPFRTLVILSSSSVGIMFYTVTYFHLPNSQNYFVFLTIGNLLVSISGIVNFISILQCAYRYLNAKLGNRAARKIFLDWALTSVLNFEDKDIEDINGSELYTNYVPALHMISMIIIGSANIYVKYHQSRGDGSAYDNRNFITLTAEIMVLVIELRIRKNEIARGLIALLASKKSYVRYISHELRTPLNTAFLGLKLLTGEMKASKCPGDAERYDTLCDVNMSCMAAVDILNDLLCYEKLESGILELHKENVTIVPFLTECVSMFSAQARECDVTMAVVTEVADDVIDSSYSLQPHDAIYADKFKMDQVIRNLISNALKFTPRGGALTVSATFYPDPPAETDNPALVSRTVYDHIQGRIKGLRHMCCAPKRVSDVHISKGNSSSSVGVGDLLRGKLVVVVTDNGAGISAENQKRLFKDIVQFSPEKLQAGGGSGLGLWITGGIVDLHGGKISVFSEGEGTGSAFTVELPMTRKALLMRYEQEFSDYEKGLYAEDSSRAGSITPTIRSQRSSYTPTGGYHQPAAYDVLVVDDSRLNRKMLMKCLQSDNHVCTEAQDGLEALAKVKERMNLVSRGIGQPFDAILMDFIMPNMDGPTATRAIRDLGYTTPIFGVTGNGLPSDIAHFLANGADRVLLKPLNLEAFGQAMKDVQSKA